MARQLEKQILMDLTMQGIQSLSTFNTPETNESKKQLGIIYEKLMRQDACEINFMETLGLIKKYSANTPDMLKTKVSKKYQEYLEDIGKQKPLDTSFEVPDFDDFEL